MQNIWHHKRYAAPKLASLTLLLGLFAASSAQSVEPVFITDGLVSANIANNGAFFSGTTLGLDYNGTEFVNQGTFASWAWLKAGGMDFSQPASGNSAEVIKRSRRCEFMRKAMPL